jgi:ABC-type nitrate/sulfonate/bicarbonate transport system ATPase subunit
MQSYIARKLEYEPRNEEGTLKTIILEDSQLLDIAQSKPIVILADAGMGKTELIKELAKLSHVKTKYLSASDLVQKSVKRLSIVNST